MECCICGDQNCFKHTFVCELCHHGFCRKLYNPECGHFCHECDIIVCQNCRYIDVCEHCGVTRCAACVNYYSCMEPQCKLLSCDSTASVCGECIAYKQKCRCYAWFFGDCWKPMKVMRKTSKCPNPGCNNFACTSHRSTEESFCYICGGSSFVKDRNWKIFLMIANRKGWRKQGSQRVSDEVLRIIKSFF